MNEKVVSMTSDGVSDVMSKGRQWIATHFPESTDPAVLAGFWDRFIEKEWPDWHRETIAARVTVFREFELKLKDRDAHCRIFNGITGCFSGVLVWPRKAADFAAEIKIYRLHERELLKIRKALSRLQKLNTVGRSSRLREAIDGLEKTATNELLGGPDDAERGPVTHSLHLIAMHKPGWIAAMVREKRLNEMPWLLQRLIASRRPGTSRRGGRKGFYATISLEATVMADIIQDTHQLRGKPISRLQALLMVGRLLSAHLPRKYIGATDERGMLNKDTRGNLSIGRPASKKERQR